MWELLSQGLFSSENRTAKQRHKQMTVRSCNINKFLIIMIILLSGDISMNPGPNHSTCNIRVLQDLARTRVLKILHQNICGLPAHKASLDELLSCHSCEQVHIIGISETHLNRHILDGEIEMDGFNMQRKDRNNGRGGEIAVYVSEAVISHRRFGLEAQVMAFARRTCILTSRYLRLSPREFQ